MADKPARLPVVRLAAFAAWTVYWFGLARTEYAGFTSDAVARSAHYLVWLVLPASALLFLRSGFKTAARRVVVVVAASVLAVHVAASTEEFLFLRTAQASPSTHAYMHHQRIWPWSGNWLMYMPLADGVTEVWAGD